MRMSFGQQLTDWVLFNESGIYYNPAYAGSKDFLELNLQSRHKLSGGTVVPAANHISFHFPVNYKRIGFGGQANIERFGQGNYWNFSGVASYKINLARGFLLSGAELGAGQYRLGLSPEKIKDLNDPLAQTDIQRARPEFGFGLLLKAKKISLGASIKHLLGSSLRRRNSSEKLIYRQRNLVVHYEYKIPLNKRMQLEQFSLLKITGGNVPSTVDVGMKASYRDFCGFSVYGNSQARLGLGAFYKFRNLFATGNHLYVNYGYATIQSKVLAGFSMHELGLSFVFDRLPDKNEILKRSKKTPPVLQN